MLPLELQRLGNAEAWKQVRAHLVGARRPLVLCGPTGTGKTVGVRQLGDHLSMDVVDVDAASCEDGLVQDMRFALMSEKGRGGRPILLVVDNFDSILPHSRLRVAKTAQDLCVPGCKTACVFVCEEARSPAVSPALKRFDCVRLRAVGYHVMRQYFAEVYRWVSPQDGVCRTGFSSSTIQACARSLSCGDVRRAANDLVWRARMGGAPRSGQDAFYNVFEATRRLLLLKIDTDTWANNVEHRDISLVQHHLPHYVEGDVCALSLSLEDLCVASEAPHDWALHVAGLATRVTTRAANVAALAPPTRLGRTLPAQAEDRAGSCLSARAYAIEVPTPLRGSSS